MKILALRGEGLASLAQPFAIDFTDAPLIDSGLFAISGRTGAGKSTLLDAICLALYDAIPRLNPQRRSASLVGRSDEEEKQKLRSNDVRSILTRGAASGYAEVDFRAGDGQRYRARWQVRRANNRADGRLQPQSMSLTCLEDDTVYSGKKTEVLGKIEALIGLDYAQFRRSVLLAQGDFSSFLKADAKERSELLERMTGTEIYSLLSRQAFETAKQKEAELQQLQGQLAGIELMAPEQREALNQQKQQLESDARELQQAQQKLHTLHRQFEQQQQMQAGCERAREQHQQLQRAWEEGEPDRAGSQLVERAQAARGCYQQREALKLDLLQHQQRLEQAKNDEQQAADQRQAAQQKLDQAQQQQQQAEQLLLDWQPKLEQAVTWQAQLDELRSSLSRQQQDLAPLQHRLQDSEQQLRGLVDQQQQDETLYQGLHQELSQSDGLASLAERLQELEVLLPTCSRELHQLSQVQSDQARLDQAERQAKHQLSQGERSLAELNQLLAAGEQRRQQWEQNLAGTDAIRLQSDYEQLHAESDWLHQLLPEMERGLQLRQHGLELIERIALNDREQQQCRAELDTQQQQLAPLEAQLAEAERSYRQQLAVLRLEEFRGELVEGEPCPLCGSESHPYLDSHPQVQSVLQLQQQRVEQLNLKLRQLRERLSQLQTLLQQMARQRQELQHEQQHQQRQLAQLQQQWRSWRNQSLPGSLQSVLSLDWELTSDADALNPQREHNDQLRGAMASLAERLAELQREQGRLSRELQALTQIRHNLDQLTSELAPLSQQQQQLTQQLQDIRAKQAQQASQMTHHQQRAEQLQGSLQQALERLMQLSEEINWPALFNNPQLFEQESKILLEALQRYRSLAQQGEQLHQAIQKRRPELSGLKQLVDELRAQHQVGAQAISGLQERQQQLDHQLLELLQQRSLGQAREWLEQTVSAARSALAGSEQGLQESMQQHVEAQRQHYGIEQQLAKMQEQNRNLLQQWLGWQQQLNLSESELLNGMRHDQDWLNARKQTIEAEQQALQQAGTRLEERQQALEHLRQQNTKAYIQLQNEHLIASSAAATEGEPGGGHGLPQLLEQLAVVVTDYQKQQQQLEEQLFQLRSQIAADQQARSSQADLITRVDKQRQQIEVWLDLRELIGSADGNRFRVFAQGLTLDNLVALANRQLRQLSPRYRLQRVPGNDLGLQVIDQEMGDEVRSVESLSGGESFLVSLSLALALASLSSQKTRLESLFIDEGFGTLDPESLDIAIACLDALQSDGKQVGVISHVETLVERIGSQIRVEPVGGGTSRVKIVAV